MSFYLYFLVFLLSSNLNFYTTSDQCFIQAFFVGNPKIVEPPPPKKYSDLPYIFKCKIQLLHCNTKFSAVGEGQSPQNSRGSKNRPRRLRLLYCIMAVQFTQLVVKNTRVSSLLHPKWTAVAPHARYIAFLCKFIWPNCRSLLYYRNRPPEQKGNTSESTELLIRPIPDDWFLQSKNIFITERICWQNPNYCLKA